MYFRPGGELSGLCVGTSFVLTRFLWRLHYVAGPVFNGRVVGEDLGVPVKEIIVPTLLSPGVI